MSYKVTIHKRIGGTLPEEWSNVYWIDASSIDVALDRGTVIADAELNILWDNVTIFKVSAQQGLGFVGAEVQLNATGLRADANPAVQLPLFNTLRVDFTAGLGRKLKKFLRLPLVEAEVTGNQYDPTFITLVQDSYIDPLISLGYFQDQQGESVTAGTPYPYVQMRQLHWSRRARPGFHRGYVPNA